MKLYTFLYGKSKSLLQEGSIRIIANKFSYEAILVRIRRPMSQKQVFSSLQTSGKDTKKLDPSEPAAQAKEALVGTGSIHSSWLIIDVLPGTP